MASILQVLDKLIGSRAPKTLEIRPDLLIAYVLNTLDPSDFPRGQRLLMAQLAARFRAHGLNEPFAIPAPTPQALPKEAT